MPRLTDAPFEASEFSLTGRGIGLTGGGGHIGSALALGLARAGAVVVICGRGDDALQAVVRRNREQQLPGLVVAEPADVGDEAEVARVLQRIEDEAGTVYGWVNNAYSGKAGRVLDAPREEVTEAVTSGLVNSILATQAAVARMAPQGEGSIVNIASMYGLVSPQPAVYLHHPTFHSPSAYGAAKAGLLQFTRYVACHTAGHGIRVNAISPGPFPGSAAQSERAFTEELRRRVPLGRVGHVDELVGPLVFLLSSASSYVTGHNLVVDGGWTAW